jgi:hypothetical protein
LRRPMVLGLVRYDWLERGSGSGTTTWQGVNANLMQSGISGLLLG